MSAKRIAFIIKKFWRFVVSRFDQPEDTDHWQYAGLMQEADSLATPTRPTLQLRRKANLLATMGHFSQILTQIIFWGNSHSKSTTRWWI